MIISPIPFCTTNWDGLEKIEHQGETGVAYWRTLYFDNIRLRMVEYSPGYLADHWCQKGHIIFCIEGEMTTELEDGRTFILTIGMTYQVGDNMEAHRTRSASGCRLFILD